MKDQPEVNPVHHHYLITALGMAIAGFATYYLVKSDEDKYRRAMEETVTTMFKQFGAASQAQGHVVDYKEIARIAKESLAPELRKEIERQNGTINNIAVAMARVEGTIAGLKKDNPPVVIQSDGSFKTTLEQNREDKPSLTVLNVDYNPKDKDPLSKSKWTNYEERFNLKFVKWTGPDGGFKNAAQVDRSVYNNGKQVGKLETLNVINNEAFFLKDDLEKMAPYPKWGLFIGGAVDLRTGKTKPGFLLDKYMSRNFQITTGVINNGAVLGGRFTFGKQ